jgi:hypothetical protein
VHALCSVFDIERAQLSVIPVVDASQLEVVSASGPPLFVVLALLVGIILGCALMYALLHFGLLR